MTAEFRIFAHQLDDGTADLAGYELAHTFGLWVGGEPVLKCNGVWNGDWWARCKALNQDPRSHPLAGRARRGLIEKLKLVQQLAADPDTEVVDLTRGS